MPAVGVVSHAGFGIYKSYFAFAASTFVSARMLVLFLSKSFFAFAASFLKAFGVAEVLSLLAHRFGSLAGFGLSF